MVVPMGGGRTAGRSAPNYECVDFLLIGKKGVGCTTLVNTFIHEGFYQPPPNSPRPPRYHKLLSFHRRELDITSHPTPYEDIETSDAGSVFDRNAGVMLVFDVTNNDSFDVVRDMFEWAKKKGGDGVQIVVVGTKIDLDSERVVDSSKAKLLCEELGIRYFEASAKTNDGVDAAFFHLLRLVLHIPEDEPKGKCMIC